jgi:hypothetical protein
MLTIAVERRLQQVAHPWDLGVVAVRNSGALLRWRLAIAADFTGIASRNS